MKTITIVLLGLCCSIASIAQTSLHGKITEDESGEPVLFANVVIYKNGILIYGIETDLDGNYSFSNIDPGTYDVEVTYVGFSPVRISKVVVFAGKANKLDIQISTASSIALEEVVVVEYKVPLIQQDNTTSGSTITSGRIRNRPTPSINGKSSKSAGLRAKKHSKKQGNSPQNNHLAIRGSRTNSASYYIDGVRVQGALLPETQNHPTDGEGYKAIQENKFIKSKKNPTSTFSIDVDRAAYSNVRRFIQHQQLPPRDAVRIEEMVNYFDYKYSGPTDHHPFAIHTEIGDCPWKSVHYLLKIGIKGKTLSLEETPPCNLILLIDASGSMDHPQKLPLVKKTFKKLINTLRPEDKVTILTFSGAGRVVLPFTSGAHTSRILQTLNEVHIDGGTNGEAGLRLAYEQAENVYGKGSNTRIIAASDGDFNIGAATLPEIEKLIEEKRTRGIYLSILGFGVGNYQDDNLEVLANKGNGNYAYIDNVMEAHKVLEEEVGQTLHTIAEDVKIQIDFDPDFIASYRLIGYENRLLATEDFEDDTKDAGELGPGHTVTALYELELTDAAIPESDQKLIDLKLRYKLPAEEQSYFINQAITSHLLNLENTSNNFRFAASVAAFGMLLQQSKFLESFDQQDIVALAKKAKGKDSFGYRQEFIELVKASERLKLMAGK